MTSAAVYAQNAADTVPAAMMANTAATAEDVMNVWQTATAGVRTAVSAVTVPSSARPVKKAAKTAPTSARSAVNTVIPATVTDSVKTAASAETVHRESGVMTAITAADAMKSALAAITVQTVPSSVRNAENTVTAAVPCAIPADFVRNAAVKRQSAMTECVQKIRNMNITSVRTADSASASAMTVICAMHSMKFAVQPAVIRLYPA